MYFFNILLLLSNVVNISLDPTGTLKENEIYIFDGNDDQNDLISSSLIHMTDVFVTRFPLLKTESISLFTVVDNDSLTRYIDFFSLS